ncbi:MAG: TIGR03668 family PPOX class F420-dependent oxidoreductase [Pseudonocardiaceae bacterium]|nr:TIGR03668 family PPOX class F420-dependent oxidoreductase [Pseudonocardiaceae bacterium]
MEVAAARRRFAEARVARLATVSRPPHLVPVTFALDGDTVYTAVDAKPKRSRQLRRLDNIEADSAVALLADHYSDDWHELWWVRADGEATVRHDPAVLHRATPLLAAKYPQYRHAPPEGPVIVVAVTAWRGWSAS